MTKNSLSYIQLYFSDYKSKVTHNPESNAKDSSPGIEVTSEELPDLYKNMTLYELKEARLYE